MLESRQDHVDLKGVSATAVAALVRFAYTGELKVSLDDVMEVLAGASHLQMAAAVKLCSRYLLNELSCSTCVDILNMSEMFSLMEVKSAVVKYMCRFFEKVAQNDQFMKLSVTHLCMFVESNELNVKSELSLFQHVSGWIAADPNQRLKEIAHVMQHIRFAMMTPEQLVDQVSHSPFMTQKSEARVYLDEALHYHVLPARQPLKQTPRTQVRATPSLVTLGGRRGMGFNIGYKHNSDKMYVLRSGKWQKLANAPSNILYAAVAVVNNYLYVCGGMGQPAHAQATCLRFDPHNSSWTEIQPMIICRQSFPLIGIPGKLYAFGGGIPRADDPDHLPTIESEMYSIELDTWTAISPLPGPRKSAAACELSGKIYISGGRTETETVPTMWSYSPDANTWEERAALLVPLAGHAMMVVKNDIYTIDRSNMGISCYSPITNQWTPIASSLGSISGIARPVVMGEWVYFLSYVSEDKDYLCRRYNVVTRKTEALPSYPEQIHCVIGFPLAFRRKFCDDNNS